MGMRLIAHRSPNRLVVIGDSDLIIKVKGFQGNIKKAHASSPTEVQTDW
jgi:hypothetical protein